jgi:flagella basal body P-ring formation protein FlgA
VLLGKCVRWPADDLAQKAKSFLSELLPVDNLTYEISVTRAPRELVTAPGQTTEVRPRLLNITPRLGTNTVALEVFVDGKAAAGTSVTLDAKAVADVMVATVTIRQGEALTSHNTSWDRRDITRLSDPIVATAGQSAPEYLARRTISAGVPITAADVTLPPIVRKGDAVTLIVTCGKVKVSAPAQALQDGRTGDIIRVSCAASQEDVHARIIDRGLVEVTP